MTEEEFYDLWDRGELDYEFDEYMYDRYPIKREHAEQDFKDSKVTIYD